MAGKSLGLPPGIEVRGGALRIRFTWNGERRGETLAYPSTPQGIKAASRLRDQVVSLARHGVLDEQKYAELFPESDLAKQSNSTIPSFGAYTQLWLDSRDLVKGTRENYKSIFNMYWMLELGTRRIDLITTSMIRAIIAKTDWTSAGVKRNAVVKLASVFKSATIEGLVSRNPTTAIDKPKVTKKVVDPYTRDEAERIIAHL